MSAPKLTAAQRADAHLDALFNACLHTVRKRARVALANSSPEAVALREAAVAFARNAKREPSDADDTRGQRLNRTLLHAAIDYAALATTGAK